MLLRRLKLGIRSDNCSEGQKKYRIGQELTFANESAVASELGFAIQVLGTMDAKREQLRMGDDFEPHGVAIVGVVL